MVWETESIWDEDAGTEDIYAWNVEQGHARHRVYHLDKDREEVTWYPRVNDFSLREVLLDGFSEVPKPFHEAGYVPGGMLYYLNKKVREGDVGRLTITREGDSRVRKIPNEDSYSMVLSYESLSELRKKLAAISREASHQRSLSVDHHFHDAFPTRYKPSEESGRVLARRMIDALDKSVIDHLGPESLDKLFDFFELLLRTRYTNQVRRQQLFSAAKLKIDHVALTEVIEQFEDLLEKNPPESAWSSFLRKNLFLVDSKYVTEIPELNVVLASERRVDFGLVDTDGYLDIFEIKKPTTRLLAKTKSRGNYYWHSDTVKALAQAEKYLFNATRKASTLEEDIRRERDLNVRVVRPRAILISGHSDQLDDEAMRHDFRVLRQSLRNVEVILYDELLIRIKNQLKKTLVELD